jgi:heat shock protein HtpX
MLPPRQLRPQKCGPKASPRSAAIKASFESEPPAKPLGLPQLPILKRAESVVTKALFSGNRESTALTSKGALEYARRLQEDGGKRVLGYWLAFGALVTGGAAAFELVIRQADVLPPGLGGLGFAALVAVPAGFSYLQLQLSKNQPGGVGASVAQRMGARKVSEKEYPGLYRSVREVAEIAEIKMPTVYVIPTDEMNAFAAGFDPKQDAVVAATEGIIKRLEPDELKAVIGHEIGHIVHGDMVSGTHLGTLLSGFYAVYQIGIRLVENERQEARRAAYYQRYSGQRAAPQQTQRERQLQAVAIPLLAVGFITYALGNLLQLSASRTREYAADAHGTAIAGASNMKGALEKLERFKDDVQKQPVFRPYRTNRNYQHLFFHVEAGADAPALGPGSILKGLAGFFSTHPPLEKRLANIDKVAAEIVDLERRLT